MKPAAQIRHLRLYSRLIPLSFVAFFFSDIADADDAWLKIENAYFQVFTNASPRRSEKILSDLDNFRAAVLQTAGIDVPVGTPKTQVIILDSRRELHALAGSGRYDAFALDIGGAPYIAMHVNGYRDWAKHAVRHEFAHALLAYHDPAFPAWYSEGFAELISGTRFRRKDTKYSIGQRIDRRLNDAPLVAWDALVSGTFAFHSTASSAVLSNALLQAGNLVHHLYLDNDAERESQLRGYLERVGSGADPLTAFETAFGQSPSSLGASVMREYRTRAPYYVVEFLPDVRDPAFTSSIADTSEVTARLQKLRRASERLQ